ncbi:hypothetical protein ACFE04_001815 [Oxalis oulophora]
MESFRSFLSTSSSRKNAKHPSGYMTSTLKLDTQNPRWQVALLKVLSTIHGIRYFIDATRGTVDISGNTHPHEILRLLERAGQHVQILKLDSGFSRGNYGGVRTIPMPTSDYDYGRSYNYHGYGEIPSGPMPSNYNDFGQSYNYHGYGGYGSRYNPHSHQHQPYYHSHQYGQPPSAPPSALLEFQLFSGFFGEEGISYNTLDVDEVEHDLQQRRPKSEIDFNYHGYGGYGSALEPRLLSGVFGGEEFSL